MNEDTPQKLEPEWFAFYTNARAEVTTLRNLTREGVESYLPIVKERHRWSDRMKWVERPMIPSYIFARITKREIYRVSHIDGVVCPVTFGADRHVVHIQPEEMEAMRLCAESESFKSVQNAALMRRGAPVVVVGGEFKGMRGELISECEDGNFALLINSIGIALVLTLDQDLLELDKAELDRRNALKKKNKPKSQPKQ